MEACRALGADKIINYKQQDFEKEVLEYTNDKGVQVIVDFVAASYLHQNINCLQTDGTMVMLALLGGYKTEINLAKVLTKRLSIIGSTLRSRPLDYQIQLVADFKKNGFRMVSKQYCKTHYRSCNAMDRSH